MANSPRQDQDDTRRCWPSGGWKRWFILAGLFFVTFLETGSNRTLSFFLDDFTFQFDVSTSYMGTIYGLVTGMPYFLGLITILLLRYFSVRQLTVFGGLLVSGGLIAASFTTTTAQITIALIAFGFGFAFIVLPTHSCLADYFPDRFDIATGVFSSGASVGVMVMPWLFDTIKGLYGWRGGLMMLGALSTHFIIIGALLKPTNRQRSRQGKRATQDGDGACGHINVNFETDGCDVESIEIGDRVPDRSETEVYSSSSTHKIKTVLLSNPIEDEVGLDFVEHGNNRDQSTISSKVSKFTDKAKRTTETKRKSAANWQDDEVSSSNRPTDSKVNVEIEVTDSRKCSCNLLSSPVKFFKEHPLMIIVCIQVYLFALPYGTWLLFTIPNAHAKGLSDLRAAQLSIAGGVANFFGRFSYGFITSRKLARIEVWYVIANMISSISFFVNYVADSFWVLVILSVMFGFAIGFKNPAQFTLVMNAVGQKHYKTGLGVIYTCGGSAFPVLGFIVGSIYDYTQSYNIAFCIMGALDVLAAILIITPVAWQQFCKRTTT